MGNFFLEIKKNVDDDNGGGSHYVLKNLSAMLRLSNVIKMFNIHIHVAKINLVCFFRCFSCMVLCCCLFYTSYLLKIKSMLLLEIYFHLYLIYLQLGYICAYKCFVTLTR